MASQVAIDARDLRIFSRKVRQASKATGQKFRIAEREAARVIADRAIEIVGPHSKKAAATVRPFTQGASSGIQTGSDKDPLGKLLEIGNGSTDSDLLRSHRIGGFFHPVFPTGSRDNWHWNHTERDGHGQAMWPHLAPAAKEKTPEALKLLLKGVNEAFRDVHLEFED